MQMVPLCQLLSRALVLLFLDGHKIHHVPSPRLGVCFLGEVSQSRAARVLTSHILELLNLECRTASGEWRWGGA